MLASQPRLCVGFQTIERPCIKNKKVDSVDEGHSRLFSDLYKDLHTFVHTYIHRYLKLHTHENTYTYTHKFLNELSEDDDPKPL